jgi:hypothetical protein
MEPGRSTAMPTPTLRTSGNCTNRKNQRYCKELPHTHSLRLNIPKSFAK